MPVFAAACAALIAAASWSAAAQTETNPDRSKPLEITADTALEWHKNEQLFVARGNALAQQGATSIRAETLTANYRDQQGGGMEISALSAAGKVEIKSTEASAFGDKATYDLDKGVAVLTGRDLRMVAPDQTVTARDHFEYKVAQGRFAAVGDATAARGEDTVRADRLEAVFSGGQGDKRKLDLIEAKGHVVITTPTETLRGDYGIYRASTNTAEIEGNVRIERGPNVLQGAKADVNLTTNVSRILGTEAFDGRVRGIFYPGSEQKPQ